MKILNTHKTGKNVPGAVYIGRPSKFGNHLHLGADGTRETVLTNYRSWLNAHPEIIDDMRRELAGKDLLCFCAPKMCHGHVIRDLVMATELVAQGFADKESAIRIYDEMDVAAFSKSRERHGLFSNMSGGYPLFIHGREIASTESLYQALRFPDHPDVQEEILAEKNGWSAKKAAYRHVDKSREDWFKVNVPLMRFVLHAKICEHREVFTGALSETAGVPIVEKSFKDAFWGAKPYINPRLGDIHSPGLLVGQNILGRLWMDARVRLEKDPDFCRDHVEDPGIPGLTLAGMKIEGYESRNPTLDAQTSLDL